MKTAILTASGARSIGHPELEGKEIQYERLTPSGKCIGVFFYEGVRLGGILYIGLDHPSAVREEDVAEWTEASTDEI